MSQENTALFQNNGELNVTTQRRRIYIVVVIVDKDGHNRQTCPQLS